MKNHTETKKKKGEPDIQINQTPNDKTEKNTS
jgi:hypothetical protein